MNYGRWFRFYDEALNDGKVQLLRPELFKVWVNLLCLSSKHGGDLPAYDKIAYSLRITTAEVKKYITELDEAELIDWVDEPPRARMHNWDERQFRSDSSTNRVHKYRERQRERKKVTKKEREIEPDTDHIQIQSGNVSRNGNETLHETVLKRFTLGQFGHVELTEQQQSNLKSELKEKTEEYINRFDVWVEEAPEAKHNGVRRKDRKAYPSILAWYRRDVAEGKIKPQGERVIDMAAIERERERIFGKAKHERN